jgi:hypothetical protein
MSKSALMGDGLTSRPRPPSMPILALTLDQFAGGQANWNPASSALLVRMSATTY